MTIAYAIEESLYSEEGSLAIRIEWLDDRGEVSPLKGLSESLLLKGVQERDRPLLPWLMNGLKKRGASTPLPIEAHQLESHLKLLSATGKLYFKNKRIVCDLFRHAHWFYKIKHQEQKTLITGGFKKGEMSFSLSDCELIRIGCFVAKGQLHLYDRGEPWRHLSFFVRSRELPFDEKWSSHLETIWKSRPDCILYDACTPKDLWGGGDPLPILFLTDRTGAFANLMMDYGRGRIYPYQRGSLPPQQQERRQHFLEKSWEDDLLTSDFKWKPVGGSQYYCPIDKVAKSLTFFLELGWQVRDYKGQRLHLCEGIDLKLQEHGASLHLKGTLQYGQHRTPLSHVVGCFNRRESFISLGDGAVGLLPESILSGDLALLAAEGEVVDEGLTLKKGSLGLLLPFKEKIAVWEISDELKKFILNPAPETCVGELLPSQDFKGELRPYQKRGVSWLAFLYRLNLHGLFADDMGLGKTVQVLAFLSTLPKREGPHLIVVPTTLLHNWYAECRRFLPTMQVYLHHGAARKAAAFDWDAYDIIITSYTLIRLDADLFSNKLFHCLVLDEAHNIKNSETQVARMACRLQAHFRLSMTGTPIENRLNELWSQFRFLMPGLFEKKEHFCADISAAESDPRFLERLRRRISPFILRRTKLQVAPELPPKIEQTVYIEMLPEQRTLYESVLAQAKSGLLKKVSLDGSQQHRFEILELLLRLRQICCHPRLFGERGLKVPSAKFERLQDEIDSLSEEKTLIYSQFTALLALVKVLLDERQQRYCYLDGATRDRAGAVTAFQTDSHIPFFLISLKAGGVGLNLTAADYVIILDPWWNDAAEQQAIDRAHRIGRERPVIAKRYILQDSIEEKIVQLKEHKSSLAHALLSADGELSSSLTQEITADDLAWLLS